MCNLAFLRPDFYLQYAWRKISCDKEISWYKGGSIKCPAGGGDSDFTLQEREVSQVTIPFPPCPRMPIERCLQILFCHDENIFVFIRILSTIVVYNLAPKRRIVR